MSQSWGPNTPPQPGAPGWTPPPPPVAPKKKGAGCAKIGCLGVLGVAAAVIAFAAVSASKSSSTPTGTSASSGATTVTQTQTTKAAAPANSPQTVTYVVTGASDADIQYGPSGSSSQGHAPMNLSQTLGNPAYYSITAQLQGSGSVSCKLEVDGKVISQATASGGYNIASCEIMQDPINGGWQDANQG